MLLCALVLCDAVYCVRYGVMDDAGMMRVSCISHRSTSLRVSGDDVYDDDDDDDSSDDDSCMMLAMFCSVTGLLGVIASDMSSG